MLIHCGLPFWRDRCCSLVPKFWAPTKSHIEFQRLQDFRELGGLEVGHCWFQLKDGTYIHINDLFFSYSNCRNVWNLDKTLNIGILLDKHSMIWHVKCVLTCLLLNLYFFEIGDRYSTFLFTGVHQTSAQREQHIHQCTCWITHNEPSCWRKQYLCVTLSLMNRKRYVFVLVPYFLQMPFESIWISQWGVMTWRENPLKHLLAAVWIGQIGRCHQAVWGEQCYAETVSLVQEIPMNFH